MELNSSAFKINRCHNLLTLKQLRMLQRNLFGFKMPKRLSQLLSATMVCATWAMTLMSPTVASEAEEISWQDLVPPIEETLFLNDQVELGEQVRTELNNKSVRIPGFLVPVDFENRQVVTRFLIVPYFGACIHEPAPPPNQTIYAEFEPGYKVESLWDPFWFEGTLTASKVEEELATASYTLRAVKIGPYVY